MQINIKRGRVIDPSRNFDAVSDLFVSDGKIVESLTNPASAHVVDASGCVIMAGGIDLHTHIGGGKVSLARMLLSDQLQSPISTPGQFDQGDSFLPTASQTASRYLDMGYTTCFEPAVIPCNARSAHAEMADVAGIDTGGYCLLGNDDVLLALIADKQPQALINDYVAWMVRATQCIAVKVVNPGGISAFKFGDRHFDVDSVHPKYGVTPAQVIETLCRAVHEIGLAHPLHVHCSNLGVPGNIESTLATIRAANGLPIHLTHAQFHSYGKDKDDHESSMVSAAAQLVDAMAKHPNVTIDVGQIMFGQTVTISADAMHQHDNFRFADPRKSILVDVECEAGCGVVPFRYRRKQFVHSLQWAIGLELFLMIDDPSRVFLTTDHPNGAPFTTYPHLIRLLADKSFRETALSEIHADAKSTSDLAGIDREYTLSDIATMTRSAPAKILGLSDRGHLSVGAVADVVVYRENDDLEVMFASPETVIRRGVIVRGKNATSVSDLASWTLTAEVSVDSSSVAKLADRYEQNSTFAMQRLQIDDEEMSAVIGSHPVVASKGKAK
ncbi:formylmethanofuran dehydrogenase subunit A [Rubripirellula amarantea]|nr:formylmethanofuran dehydrogenase subunit A [Rubripirellula amarantea]